MEQDQRKYQNRKNETEPGKDSLPRRDLQAPNMDDVLGDIRKAVEGSDLSDRYRQSGGQ